MDTQRSRRRESTSPLRVNLAERGKPVLPLPREVGKPSGQPKAVRVGGWEKAKAALSWGGDGLRPWSGQHHPTRKRADFPTVSRHENQGGIDTEGVANGGGSFHWCYLPHEGIDFSTVSCSQQVVSLLTGPSHGL